VHGLDEGRGCCSQHSSVDRRTRGIIGAGCGIIGEVAKVVCAEMDDDGVGILSAEGECVAIVSVVCAVAGPELRHDRARVDAVGSNVVASEALGTPSYDAVIGIEHVGCFGAVGLRAVLEHWGVHAGVDTVDEWDGQHDSGAEAAYSLTIAHGDGVSYDLDLPLWQLEVLPAGVYRTIRGDVGQAEVSIPGASLYGCFGAQHAMRTH